MQINFGQFLVNKKVITEEQLESALSSQTDDRFDFGFLAGVDGKMKDYQIEFVLNAMKEDKNFGKKFSDVLRELEIMPSNDVDRIAKLENKIDNKIGETLVILNHISKEELNKYFKEFLDLKNV
ncbi:MAG TPA: hypothetical protein QF468_12980 [Nitrospinota bacterium]|nr:hypothetical protein [Nitrospinota bacterium]|tara:strand:- start:120 stop:491 length:372 start_codon:yes stop_codon:yes gene_type:complete